VTGLEIVLVIIAGSMTLAGGLISLAVRRKKDISSLESLHRDELESLANTRKEIIAELRADMDAQNRQHAKEIGDLNAQIAELRGQYHAMRNFQVQEVVSGVIRGVLEGLGAVDLS
jgi:outer membrane murein-binding lipoprotein Lpp